MSTPELMTQELVYEVLYNSLSLADSIVQIWFTITFALIVAAYFAGSRVGQSMFRLISGLYGLYAAVLITRYVSSAIQIIHYRDLLVESGFEPWPVPYWVSFIIGSGTFILMFAGTIATLWFTHWTTKQSNAG